MSQKFIATMAAAAFAAITVNARTVLADDLTVYTVEHGSWPAAVAALQSDVRAEGRAVRVFVRDDGNHRLPCGTYTLTLDAVAEDAFALGQCDPSSRATEVRLLHRAALFGHDDFVPRPLAAGISAVQVRTGGASGGAGNSGGSELACSVAVRPYLRDLEHGTQVFLTPGRFILRPLIAGIVADGGPGGWTLRSGPRATMTIEYDVVDTRDQSVVLHDRATLSCGSAPAPVGGVASQPGVPPSVQSSWSDDEAVTPAIAAACGNAPDITFLPTVQGSTVNSSDHFHASCADGAAHPDRVYQLHVDRPATVTLRLESSFDGVLYLRESCAHSASEIACNDDDGDTRHSTISRDLRPGTYFVFVDAYGTAAPTSCSGEPARTTGTFTLTTRIENARGPVAATPAHAAFAESGVPLQLRPGVTVSGTTVGHPDHYHSSCASGSSSPDQAYTIDLDRRSLVHIALSGDYDGSLYIRSALGRRDSERACNDDANDTRHSVIDATLPAGRYYVIVDGFSSSNSGAYQLRADVYGVH